MFGNRITAASQESRSKRLADFCAKMGDAGIAATFLLAPLFLGGRHGLGLLVYAITVAIAAIGVFGSAALKQRIATAPRSIQWLLIGAIGIGILQLIPLPPSWLAWLSPEYSAKLLFFGNEWFPLTATPHATRGGVALLLVHSMLLLTLYERLRSREDVLQLMRLLSLAVVGMMLIGFVQYAMPNGKMLWFYSHPSREFGQAVLGTFSNRNHMAHFLVLGLGPLCWLAYSFYQSRSISNTVSQRQSISWLMLILGAIILLVVAVLATRSRGGAGALAISSMVITFCYWRMGTLQAKHVLVLSLLLVIAIGGVSVFGYEHVSSRLDDLVSGDLEELDANGARRAIWGANLDAFSASPWLGFGLGSHREVYPLFLEESFPVEFTHAESSYLQIASESGVAGLLLLGLAIVLLVRATYRGLGNLREPSDVAIWAAIIAGLTASLCHAAVDFVWYIPSLMAMTIALAICAIRFSAFSLSNETHPSKVSRSSRKKQLTTPAIARLITMGLATCWAFTVLTGTGFAAVYWDSYLHVSNSLRVLSRQAIAGDEDVTDQYLHETLIQNTIRSTETLEKIVALDPQEGKSHLRLAGRYLQQFELEMACEENRMPVEYLRDAALKGGFKNHSEIIAWVEQVQGPRAELLKQAYYHARQAVKLCPLEGTGYLYLATLSFLDPQPTEILSWVEQAIKVRPYEGGVQFEAGRQYQLTGDWDKAMLYWKDAIQRPGSHQLKLTAMLAPLLPANLFVEQLVPNQKVIDVAVKQYRLHGDKDDLLALANYARQSIEQSDPEEKPRRVANRWRQLSSIERSLDRNQEAIEAAQKAFELDPYSFYVRLEMAWAFYKGEEFDAADPHIRWCLARRPDIRYLKTWLVDSAKRRTKVDQNRRKRLYTLRETPSSLLQNKQIIANQRLTPLQPLDANSDRLSRSPHVKNEVIR